ncbi:hypothetical protein C457_19078 [Haloferax prahovense DSM 18310]|uniref:Uncharacterized protein n=1 Tax=Haloferax prahovense (strain DSM 18310 / JCM 13924 / TL6) TaxID=1227461 RepID=M0FTT5_HALPT|nr:MULTISPECIES: hypothetical protein [Haloferax]ELZ63375.1 hypothetical protein C457_19078 [Haloferax prahovense DSM 18310]
MNALAVASAAFAVFLFVVALFAMTVGELQGAGLAFLSASLVIYLREKYLVGE